MILFGRATDRPHVGSHASFITVHHYIYPGNLLAVVENATCCWLGRLCYPFWWSSAPFAAVLSTTNERCDQYAS